MPTLQATVTADSGPASQSTAAVFTGLSAFAVDVARSVLMLYKSEISAGPWKEFDLDGVTTFTVSISGGNYTVTVS